MIICVGNLWNWRILILPASLWLTDPGSTPAEERSFCLLALKKKSRATPGTRKMVLYNTFSEIYNLYMPFTNISFYN